MYNDDLDLEEINDDKKELEILKEIIKNMQKTEEYMQASEKIKDFEYEVFDYYLQELEDRAMNFEIEINGCMLEEI